MKLKLLCILLLLTKYIVGETACETPSTTTTKKMKTTTTQTPVTDDETEEDILFDNKGYPSVGDVPILNRKIFRGTRVSIREHGYIVSIRRLLSHYLTGTLVTRNLVLTVAHPIHNVPIDELGVVVGENYSDRGTSLLTVIFILIHEEFNPYTLYGDIAIMRIYEDLVFRSNVRNINLISITPESSGTAFATGWGRCDFMGKELCLPRSSKYFPNEILDPMLRSISISLIPSSSYCDDYEKLGIQIRPGMLCTGQARAENPVAPCLAVPGAPLVANANLIGILSWGFGCGYMYDLPLIYTSIQYYLPWLVYNIDILKTITKENATGIFSATKAFKLLKWLDETRQYRQKQHGHLKPMQKTELDVQLAKLLGKVFDIRDYVYNASISSTKQEIFMKLRQVTTNTTGAGHPKYEIHLSPFLDNTSLNMDYYFDDVEDA